ncbi:MAG: glutathione peroxidase [Bacteroidia bacterium]
MKKLLIFIFSSAVAGMTFFGFITRNEKTAAPLGKSFYDLSIKSLDGKSTIKLSNFKGKKVLCVNTASQCGFTYQYEKLEKLYEKYKGKLVVIGFPCNQFGEQEPWEADHIEMFCKGRYSVTFPLTEKINVKGDSAHLVYQWLTQKKNNHEKDVNIRWNFGKFLISEKGKFIEYFPSKVEPDDPALIALIEK